MAGPSDGDTPGGVVPTPETAGFLLSVFTDLYRQEIAAEEDVHSTLPFFGTALGIVIGALAYAAGRLPRWPDVLTQRETVVYSAASVLLGLAIIEASYVLFWLARALLVVTSNGSARSRMFGTAWQRSGHFREPAERRKPRWISRS
jgi:hypothetical protein